MLAPRNARHRLRFQAEKTHLSNLSHTLHIYYISIYGSSIGPFLSFYDSHPIEFRSKGKRELSENTNPLVRPRIPWDTLRIPLAASQIPSWLVYCLAKVREALGFANSESLSDYPRTRWEIPHPIGSEWIRESFGFGIFWGVLKLRRSSCGVFVTDVG